MNIVTLLCIAFKLSNPDDWISGAKLESTVVYFVNESRISLASPELAYRKHYASVVIYF